MITPASSTSVAHHREPNAFVYKIVESASLPVIDLSKSVRSSWLNKRVAGLWMRFLRRYQRLVLCSYYVSIALYPFGFFLSAHVGQWIAVAAVTTGLIGSLSSISMLRSDIVQLLLGTYEVWFFSVVNALSSVLLAMYLGGPRALLALPKWLSVQSSILLDANIITARHFIFTSVLTGSYLVAVIVCIDFGVLDDVHSFVVLPSRVHALSVEAALVNGWVTIVLLLGRNTYRRREALKKLGVESKLVQCISYRVKIKLVRVEDDTSTTTAVVPSSSPLPANSTRPAVASPIPGARLPVPMTFVAVSEQFDAADTVLPLSWLFPIGSPLPRWMRCCAQVLALVGFLLTLASFCAVESSAPVVALNVSAFAATSTFCAVSLGMYQRQLLRRLVLSFDYAFLSLQIIAAHVCVCDLFAWDHRSFCTMANLLWVLWVLTIDAITPVMRHRWGIHMAAAGAVLALYVVVQCAIVSSAMFDRGIKFRDRSFFEMRLGDFTIQLRTMPMLLSRAVTLLGWSCRVLWRIWHHRGDELIVMQGGVVFESNMRSVRRAVKQLAVAPATNATTKVEAPTTIDPQQ